MTVIDFHPDDLLEREGRGTLSAAEQQRLTDHLARCASCRIERQLRADFEQELGPQSAPGMLHALVSGALRAAGTPEREPDAELVRERPRVRRVRRPLATLLGVGMALGTGLAAARSDLGVRALDVAREQVRLLLGQNPTPSTQTITEARGLSSRAKSTGVAAPATSAATPIEPAHLPASGTDSPSGLMALDSERVGERTDPPSTSIGRSNNPDNASPRAELGEEPSAKSPRTSRRATAHGEGASGAGAPRAARTKRAESGEGPRRDSLPAGRGSASDADREGASGVGAPRAARAKRAESGEGPRRDSLPAGRGSASDPLGKQRRGSAPDPLEKQRRGSASDPLEITALFDRANAARRGGSGAEALYQELQARFPQSAEARLSQAILGRMKLDSGDAEAAIAHFEAYLSTGDRPLREQAMAGCALAWARLGRADRERQSWRALLAAYPGSAYADLARQRLAREAP